MHLVKSWMISIFRNNIKTPCESWFDEKKARERASYIQKELGEDGIVMVSEGSCQDPGEYIYDLVKEAGLLSALGNVTMACNVGAVIKAVVESQPLGITEEVENFVNNKIKITLYKDKKFSYKYARDLKGK